MSEFYTLLDEYVGDSDSLTEIRAVVRRLWFYDFVDNPLRIWQGKGKLTTFDDLEWLGTIDGANNDHHKTPLIQDGRDGSSPTYQMTLTIPDIPGESQFQLFEKIKTEQALIKDRTITCYMAIFKEGEGLRPDTPYVFFKQLNMISTKFSENIEGNDDGGITKNYKVTLIAKDANFGRSNRPNGTYADTIQKQRALELGVSTDKGSEFLAALANRTYTIP
jgi:hypothetical protein